MRTEAFSHSRHPFQIYILALCLLTGIPTMLGIAPKPGAIESLVPPLIAVVWSYTLVIGAAMGLGGSFWRNRGTGLILEQLGLSFAGYSCLFYAVILVVYAWAQGGLVAASVITGFGLSCLIRSHQIQQYLNRVNGVAKRNRIRLLHISRGRKRD